MRRLAIIDAAELFTIGQYIPTLSMFRSYVPSRLSVAKGSYWCPPLD